MADKIVQLINKDGDNIYPVASVPNSAIISMTTTDPGEGSALADNNYIGVYGMDPIIMDYSTSEINTGAKWIDGNAIYKKTVSFGTLPNNDTKDVAHNISNLGTVIDVRGVSTRSTDHVAFPLPFPNATASNNISMTVSPTNVTVRTGTDRTSLTETYITVYYTKTS